MHIICNRQNNTKDIAAYMHISIPKDYYLVTYSAVCQFIFNGSVKLLGELQGLFWIILNVLLFSVTNLFIHIFCFPFFQ